MADINKIIAAISPTLYHEGDANEIKEIIKKYGFATALEKVKPLPSEEHTLVYDSTTETLEPVYFWILDYMNNIFGGDVQKLTDNFASSPGSGHFAEIGVRATRMQEEAMKILGSVNTVLKSIINIIYDLKEFEIRLKHYEDSKSKNKGRAESGLLSLKQIWMDNVDIKRGQGSINAMASGNLQFVTLRDAFMAVDSVEAAEKLDLNERVKRILKPRIAEFLEWKKLSEKELKQRYEVERSYLKSQVNALQLYTRWAKPYLKAATALEMKDYERKPDLVTAFNTLYLELVIFAKSEFKLDEAIVAKDVPQEFTRFLGKKKKVRDYYSCVLVEFSFRGIPNKVGQHYTMGGRAEVKFKGYALNDEELDALEEELKKDDFAEALKLVRGVTDESLEQLKDDLDHYLRKEEKEAEEEAEKESEDVNPFAALIGLGGKKSKKKYKEEKKGKKEEKKEPIPPEKIKRDSYEESVIRGLVEQGAKSACFKTFDVYKKAHAMASHPDPSEYWTTPDI